MEQPSELTSGSLWNEVAGRLRGALNDSTYRTWFGEVQATEERDALVLAVPNNFTREWIEGHFLDLIRAAARDASGRDRAVRLVIDDSLAETGEEQPQREAAVGLNPKYTFDLFVIGSSNRFAHAAALAVAETPARAYNPLFIYGSTGLGKTHLLQAIAHYVTEHASRLSVRYVTSETFMNDFINSLRDRRIEGFKQRYRNYDVLLIDDVQFFEHKERIQEEFFHTFNSLYESGSQIIISSDRPPREIATLEARLRSRFEWGLITDIQPPDLETRIAILRKKVHTDSISISDTQVLTFIASRISTNIRELEGALTRVVAFSSLTGRADDRRARAGRAEGRLPAGRGRPGVDRADPGGRLTALLAQHHRALRQEEVAEHRLPAPGRDVPLARAHRLFATEDRQARSEAATTRQSCTQPRRSPASSSRIALCTTSCKSSPRV